MEGRRRHHPDRLTPVPFEITIDGHAYRTDDFTIDEAEQLEVECGRTWLELNPTRSAKEFRATVALFLRRTRSPEVAAKEAGAMSVKDAQDNMRWVSDNLPTEFMDGIPKEEGSPSTTTSSSSLDPPGDGPPT
jgi:hypothetical protein